MYVYILPTYVRTYLQGLVTNFQGMFWALHSVQVPAGMHARATSCNRLAFKMSNPSTHMYVRTYVHVYTYGEIFELKKICALTFVLKHLIVTFSCT